jgi:hypothetical protein
VATPLVERSVPLLNGRSTLARRCRPRRADVAEGPRNPCARSDWRTQPSRTYAQAGRGEPAGEALARYWSCLPWTAPVHWGPGAAGLVLFGFLAFLGAFGCVGRVPPEEAGEGGNGQTCEDAAPVGRTVQRLRDPIKSLSIHAGTPLTMLWPPHAGAGWVHATPRSVRRLRALPTQWAIGGGRAA